MTTFKLSTPVVFFIYKRADVTRKSFLQIAKARPAELYIIADGAKSIEEESSVREVREILGKVNWNCQLHTNISEENMGCRKRIITGLEWVFSRCDEAIIIEDDVVVSTSFFKYAQELLEYYRSDERVYSISGCNLGYENKKIKDSYSYSNFMNMWGWATWKSTFRSIDFEMEEWGEASSADKLKKILKKDRDELWLNYWESNFNRVASGEIDTWDFQWICSQLLRGGVSIFPTKNMVINIGYGKNATHTGNLESLDRANLNSSEVKFPLRHPRRVKINKQYEKFIMLSWCNVKIPNIFERSKMDFITALDGFLLSPMGRPIYRLMVKGGWKSRNNL